MKKKRIVVSLGHEALGYTIGEQHDAVKKTAAALADLVEADYQLVITHSNGPQVSMIHKAMTELRRIYPDYTPAPMCVCSAMSQGYVGYDIQNALRSELLSRGISKPVSTILTQVTVDPYDEAFYEPQKVIGRYMTKEEAELEIQKGNYVVEEEQGFRRVVAAPTPIDIVELESIKTLSDADQVVIACGGGGIPVIEQKHALQGASAVIEKDCIAGKLATDLEADELVILTSVEHVYKDFASDNRTPLTETTLMEVRDLLDEGTHFGETDMKPKVEAAISYLKAVPRGCVRITSINHANDAMKGKTGTIIKNI